MDILSIAQNTTQIFAEAASGAAAGPSEYIALGGGIAIAGTVLGAGLAIGKLAAAALESSARQPEIQGKLQTMMILALAFIEALALIGILFGALLLK